MSDRYHGNVKAGAASVSLPVLLVKTADSTEQTGKAAADVTASYWRQGGTRTAITTSDLASVNSAYSAGGWKEVDGTNQPGLYRLDVPDAAFASGADWAIVSVKVASCFVYHERIALETAGSAEVYSRIGAAGAGLTALGDTRLANLDATVASRLAPTIAGRTLDVTTTGEAGIDWANVGNPTTTVTLSGTTVGTTTALTSLPTMPTDWLTAAGLSAGAVTEIQSGLSTYAGGDTAGTTTLLTRLSAARAGYLDNLNNHVAQTGDSYPEVTSATYGLAKLVRSTTPANTLDVSATGEAGLDFANVKQATAPTTLTNVTVPVVTTLTNLPTMPTDWLTAAGLSAGAGAEFAAAAWDLATSGHTTSGTFGAAAVAAGSAGDPWSTSLPGSYGAGTAGKIVGDNLNATVGSRSSHAAADVWAVTTRTITGGTITTYAGNTPQTGDSFPRIGVNGAGLTALGDVRLANLDAAISSRSSYAGADTAGTTTLLARLTTPRATNLDNLDAAVSSRSSHSAAAVWAAGTRTLTAFGFSVTVAANADKTGYSLTSAYDAAKTAAQPSDVSGGGGSGAPGQVLVDHAFGATSGDPAPLAWADAGSGAGIADAQILAYPAADYDAGRRGRPFLVGLTTTDLEGRWAAPIFLDPGAAYVLVYVNRGRYRPRVVRVSVP